MYLIKNSIQKTWSLSMTPVIFGSIDYRGMGG